MKTDKKKIISLFLSLAFLTVLPFLSLASTVEAQSITEKISESSKNRELNLNIPIGDFDGTKINVDLLGEYIKAWYDLLLGTVGIIATILIMWGGFKWLTSRGDSKQISDAQDIIWSAITGMILAFGSFLIISLVDPTLTDISMPTIEGLRSQGSNFDGARQYSKGAMRDGLGQSTATDGQLGKSTPENKNSGPKVPCASNKEGQKDYTMAYIASHEGYKNVAYTDAIDSNTQNIYFGHQVKSGEKFNNTEEEGVAVLRDDIYRSETGYLAQAIDVASQHGVNFRSLSPARQTVLVDMAYNLGGTGLNGFTNMWSQIKSNNFEQAGKEILNSKYYNQLKQTGRPQMNADIMAAEAEAGNQMLTGQAAINCQ